MSSETAETLPVDTPAGTETAEPEPTEPEPTESEGVSSQTAETEPVDAEPREGESAGTGPIETEAAVAGLATVFDGVSAAAEAGEPTEEVRPDADPTADDSAPADGELESSADAQSEPVAAETDGAAEADSKHVDPEPVSEAAAGARSAAISDPPPPHVEAPADAPANPDNAIAASGAQFTPEADPPQEQRRRSTTVLAGAVAVAAVVVLVVLLAVFLGHSNSHKAASRPTSTAAITSAPLSTSATGPTTTPSPVKSPSTGPEVPAQTALGRWATANLSKKTIIAADSGSAKTLTSAGFTNVVSENATNVDWHSVAFLVRNRNLGHPSPLRTELANASSPLALFGTGSQEITVSQVYPDLGSGLSTALVHDRSLRKQAGSQLVQNPSITFSPSAKKTAEAGGLDMRAAAVLVLLAKSTSVYVIDIVDDPAEARASRPSRTIVISAGNLNMVQQTLSSIGLDYRPAHVQVIDQNAVQMQWIPAIVPVAGG